MVGTLLGVCSVERPEGLCVHLDSEEERERERERERENRNLRTSIS